MAISFEKADLEKVGEHNTNYNYLALMQLLGTDFKLKQLGAIHSTQMSQ